MQISMKYHMDEFDSLENMLDPDSNVKYAAKFLKKLFLSIKDGMRQFLAIILQYHLEKRNI